MIIDGKKEAAILREEVKKEIALIKSIYAASPYNPSYGESCPIEKLELIIDPALFWETLLVQIRGKL